MQPLQIVNDFKETGRPIPDFSTRLPVIPTQDPYSSFVIEPVDLHHLLKLFLSTIGPKVV
jgi:hypothetical protein